MCNIVVALASGSPKPSKLTKNPAISVCMASTSQAGCPSTILEPASGTAYVQEVPEANLLHFLLTVNQHSECRGLEVQMHTAAQMYIYIYVLQLFIYTCIYIYTHHGNLT